MNPLWDRLAQQKAALDIMAGEIERLKAALIDCQLNTRKTQLANAETQLAGAQATCKMLRQQVVDLGEDVNQAIHERDLAVTALEPLRLEARRWRARVVALGKALDTALAERDSG